MAYQQLAKRSRDQSTQKQFNQFFTVGEGQVYIVSMGHRLQTISFSQENSTVSDSSLLLLLLLLKVGASVRTPFVLSVDVMRGWIHGTAVLSTK